MIQKGSFLIPVDKNGVWWVSTFHIYGGHLNKYTGSGYFIKVSIKKIKNNLWTSKKSKLKAIVILTKKETTINSYYLKFKLNSCVVLKKRLSSLGSEILGPSIKKIKKKKFIYAFSGIL